MALCKADYVVGDWNNEDKTGEATGQVVEL
jgi:hypothetical protein